MSVRELDQITEDREYRLQRLRLETFRGAGYSLRSALRLVIDPEVDLALAEKLARLGCPEETALRILL